MSAAAAMIMTTVKDRDDARVLAEHLIGLKAAACVQEISINSRYRWEGKIAVEPEILLLIKTAADRADFAVEAIRSKHPYQVPEILVVPIASGLGAYLRWLEDETRPEET